MGTLVIFFSHRYRHWEREKWAVFNIGTRRVGFSAYDNIVSSIRCPTHGHILWRESWRFPVFQSGVEIDGGVEGGGWKQDARRQSRRFRTSPPVRARKLVICLSIRARAWKKESVYGVFNASEREEIWPPVGRRGKFWFSENFCGDVHRAAECEGDGDVCGTAPPNN